MADQNSANNQNSGQSGQSGQNDMEDKALQGARDQAQTQVDNAIDQFAQKVPGGEAVSGTAKNAVHGVLDNLEQQAQNKADEMLGGMLGGILGGKKGE